MSELRYQAELLKAMNQKLSAKEKMYQFICDTSYHAYLYYSFKTREITLLGNWKDFFDFEIRELKEVVRLFDIVEDEYVLTLRDVLFPEKTRKEEAYCECLHKNKKQWLEFRTSIRLDEAGEPTDKMICISDITNVREQKEELAYKAYHDTLTGLYNRSFFIQRLHDFMQKADNDNSNVTVMVVEINDFCNINDSLGYQSGDELLCSFGESLAILQDENVILGHFSDGMFCIAVYDPVGRHSIEHIHKVLGKMTKEPYFLSNGRSIFITVSAGTADYPEAADQPLKLVNFAEIVMKKGKVPGRNSIEYFSNAVLKEFAKNMELENRLREAIAGHRFMLYYQPQFYTGNKRLRGMEALIRWKEGEQMISPAIFIPIAEKSGLITSIGNWVLEEGIRQYAEWMQKYPAQFSSERAQFPSEHAQYSIDQINCDKDHIILSINISAIQYKNEDFADNLKSLLDKYHVRPQDIELEITESVFIDDFQSVLMKLKSLRAYGIKISLDDFGTGYSSLSYLKKLPIDMLKIDKSFIDTILTDSATRVITESIVNMVKVLGCETIAEGVEEEKQFEYLHAIGCDVIQGYFLGKPQPAKEIERLF